MKLKTLDGKGHIKSIEYSEAECARILRESEGYVLQRVHCYGNDYGGSHCSDERVVSCEDIEPQLVLVENGHFCGVVIERNYENMSGR